MTGRYLYANFLMLLNDCLAEQDCSLVIEQNRRMKQANTAIFYIQSAYYRTYLSRLYRECDDRIGQWVERVLYRRLCSLPEHRFRLFSIEPDVRAISGSTSQLLRTKGGALRRMLRKINRAVDPRYIWYKPIRVLSLDRHRPAGAGRSMTA